MPSSATSYNPPLSDPSLPLTFPSFFSISNSVSFDDDDDDDDLVFNNIGIYTLIIKFIIIIEIFSENFLSLICNNCWRVRGTLGRGRLLERSALPGCLRAGNPRSLSAADVEIGLLGVDWREVEEEMEERPRYAYI